MGISMRYIASGLVAVLLMGCSEPVTSPEALAPQDSTKTRLLHEALDYAFSSKGLHDAKSRHPLESEVQIVTDGFPAELEVSDIRERSFSVIDRPSDDELASLRDSKSWIVVRYSESRDESAPHSIHVRTVKYMWDDSNTKLNRLHQSELSLPLVFEDGSWKLGSNVGHWIE